MLHHFKPIWEQTDGGQAKPMGKLGCHANNSDDFPLTEKDRGTVAYSMNIGFYYYM